MTRGKLQLHKIEKNSKRNVTFSKRQRGLMKKARELSILCDAEIGVIVFSDTGNLHDFASSSMNQVLRRYNKYSVGNEVQIPDSGEVAALKAEIRQLKQLKQKQMQLVGKELNGLGVCEIKEVEELQAAALLSVKERKEQLQMQDEQLQVQDQLQQANMKMPDDQLEQSKRKEVRTSPGTSGNSGPYIASIQGAKYAEVTRESQLRAGPRFYYDPPKGKVAEKSASSAPAVEVTQPTPEVETRQLPKEEVSIPTVDNSHQRPKRERRLPKALMDYDI